MEQENEMGREKEPHVMVRSASRDDSLNSSAEIAEETVIHAPPPVPPRRKSSDKLKLENKENVHDTTIKRLKMLAAEAGNKMVSDYKFTMFLKMLFVQNQRADSILQDVLDTVYSRI
jgi:hypothetical protein